MNRHCRHGEASVGKWTSESFGEHGSFGSDNGELGSAWAIMAQFFINVESPFLAKTRSTNDVKVEKMIIE